MNNEKQKKRTIMTIIGLVIVSLAMVLIMLLDTDYNDFNGAISIDSMDQMDQLKNYTGNVIISGVLTVDSNPELSQNDQVCYRQIVEMERMEKYKAVSGRVDTIWKSTITETYFGKNAKINGLPFDIKQVKYFSISNKEITALDDTHQREVFLIEGTEAEVIFAGTMKDGRIIATKLISTDLVYRGVVLFLKQHENEYLVKRQEKFGVHFMNLLLMLVIETFLLRYVFLVPVLKSKNQKLFFGILAFIIGVMYEVTGSDSFATLMSIGWLWVIFFSTYKNTLYCLITVVTLKGLSEGLVNPLVILPSRIMEISGKEALWFRVIITLLLFLCSVSFFVLTRKQRYKMEVELKGRTLDYWQEILILFTGLLMYLYTTVLNMRLEYIFEGFNEDPEVLQIIAGWLGILSFALTITVITVLIFANRQAYYYSRVSDMQFNIIELMAEIVENRDANTGGHIQRTAQYVEILAKELKREGKFPKILSDEYIANMRLTAPLHDIGKIHVPDLILNKPGRLDDEEFAVMKTHAEEGKKLLTHAKEYLGTSDYLNMAVDMAAAHHEWWDGSKKGYPGQLSGEEIPLSARIMAVADVFDALTSKRVYKNPIPVDTAYQIILEEKGTHFDPEVIEAFVSARDQIEKTLNGFFNEQDEVKDYSEIVE